jgi:hypothetical protein
MPIASEWRSSNLTIWRNSILPDRLWWSSYSNAGNPSYDAPMLFKTRANVVIVLK